MRTVANVLSVVLHPLWMPTLLILLCFRIDPFLSYGFATNGLLIVYGMVFCMTAVFPLSSAFLMHRTGMVSDITMPLRQERIPAYFTTLLYYGMCYYLLRRTGMQSLMLGIFFGACLALLLVLLITVRWKISAHMVGIGGLVGAVLATTVADGTRTPILLALLFVVAGALGTARLVATDHTSAQVYAGALLGCGCVFMCGANMIVI